MKESLTTAISKAIGKGRLTSKEVHAELKRNEPFRDVALELGRMFQTGILKREMKSKQFYYFIEEELPQTPAPPPVKKEATTNDVAKKPAPKEDKKPKTATKKVAKKAEPKAAKKATPKPAASKAPTKKASPAPKAASTKKTAVKAAKPIPKSKPAPKAKTKAGGKGRTATATSGNSIKKAPPIVGIRPDGTVDYSKLTKIKKGLKVSWEMRGRSQVFEGVVLFVEWFWWHHRLNLRVYVPKLGKECWVQVAKVATVATKKASDEYVKANNLQGILDTRNAPFYANWKKEICLAALKAPKEPEPKAEAKPAPKAKAKPKAPKPQAKRSTTKPTPKADKPKKEEVKA